MAIECTCKDGAFSAFQFLGAGNVTGFQLALHLTYVGLRDFNQSKWSWAIRTWLQAYYSIRQLRL